MSVFLGFDAGGTKTDCVLLDSGGRVIGEVAGGPANPLRSGFARSCAVLGETAQRALAEAHAEPDSVRAICAGIAGAGRPRVARRMASYLSHAFPQATVRVTTDIEIALTAAVPEGTGVVVIAGTGSAVCGRNSRGQLVRAGGWGPAIGDPGSAYDIGRHAVEAALRARDGAGPSTILGSRILLAQETSDWDAVIERIAKRPDAVFPRVFPAVAESAAENDDVAQQILSAAAKALAQLAEAVVRRLEIANEAFPLAKHGGVFGRSHSLDAVFDAEISRIAPKSQIFVQRVSAARAAAEMAHRSVAAAAHGA